MQSITLPAVEHDYWTELMEEMSGLPSSSTGDFDYNQLMDFDSEFDAAASDFGPSGGLEQLDQWGASFSQHPEPEPEPSSIQVSTAFDYNRIDADGNTADFAFVSSDGVHFAVNATTLRANSSSAFGGLLVPTRSSASVALSSAILNLILHAVYDMSVAKYAPSLDDLDAAVDALEQFGLSKQTLVHRPESSLFQAILNRALSQSLDCYTLAAYAGLDALAIAISPYTLALPLSAISDDHVARMGPIYLRRLFFLHLGRMEALKRIIRNPPDPHPRTEDCEGHANKSFLDAWVTKVVDIQWTPCPNISTISLQTRLGNIAEKTDCPDCLVNLDHRIQGVVSEWSSIKNTI